MSNVFLLITMIFNVTIYCTVYSHIRKTYKKKFRPKVGKLKYFPITLFICWVFAFLDYLTKITYKDIDFLKIPHIFFATSQGFVNSLVYLY